MATALRLLKSGGVGGAVSMAATRRVVGGLGTATPLRALMAVAGPSVAVPRVPAVNPAVASSRTFAASSGGDRTDDFVSSPASGYIHADYNDEPKVPEIARVIKNNREWAAAMLADDPDFFSRHTESQAPNYLFVGCSDSRVPANEIMGLKAGEVFVHRNIANLVVGTDMNLLSVLQYSVEVLGVKDIIVCGHYGCGGVQAAMKRNDHGLLENWLRNIRDVARLHDKELSAIKDEEAQWRRLVELSVGEQCINLFKTGIVQRQQQKTGVTPRIHGLVYDISDGMLHKLRIDFAGYAKKYAHVFQLYDLQTEANEAGTA